MTLGVVRVPLNSSEFPHRRQISFKVREKLRVFKNLAKAGAAEVCIPCTVEEAEFGEILAHLGLSSDQLCRTRGKGQKDLPLLAEIRLLCLYGEHLVAVAKANKETSLIVHLFSADLLDLLLEIISTFSYETQQSDRELYRKIVESYYCDEITYTFCIGCLTEPKERNMKMLIRPKNLAIVKTLNSLLEILAIIEQLVLGSIYKWLALHIDEQIIHYLEHISARLFDNGMLFPSVTDSSDRNILRRNILSYNIVIPSFETLQENIHYIGFAAKILVRPVIDELPLCKSSKKRSPTVFEVLSGSWVAPEVVKVEANDGELTEIEGPASPSLAFKQLCLASLRLFPWLEDALPPIEDYGDGEHALGPEEEQGTRAPVARPALDKIRPRRKTAAFVATKTPRKHAEGVPRREAGRSVIGGPAIARNLARKAVESGGAVRDSIAQVLRPTPGREAAQTTNMAAPIPLTDLPIPQASQGVQNPQSESLDPARDAGGVRAVPGTRASLPRISFPNFFDLGQVTKRRRVPM
ncbi:hypothetical protein V8F33_002412 [Rhypophila sp. PSN 637]